MLASQDALEVVGVTHCTDSVGGLVKMMMMKTMKTMKAKIKMKVKSKK